MLSPNESVTFLNARVKDKHLKNHTDLQKQRLPPHRAAVKQAISKELFVSSGI
jgi:hypothetical protein